MSRVTVAIPNYNGEKYIQEALESILAQTYSDFDILVVDDCSTDKSWEILQTYARQEPRIRILQNEKNEGIPKTRNRLVYETEESEYIAFLDNDDVMNKTRLEKQVAYLDAHPEIAAVGSWFLYADKNLKPMRTRRYKERWCGTDPGVLHNPLAAHSAVTARRSLYEKVGEYDKSLKGAEDYDFWLRALLAGECIGNVQEVLTTYRVHDAQGTMLHNEHQKSGFRVRWKYLFKGFFSVQGLFVTLGIGTLSIIPKPLRNTLRVLAIRLSS